MTEDQAREKWCPMVRYPLWPDECSGGNEGAKCIASDCMMWRWQLNEKGQVVHNNISLMDKDRQGYCGLANKP